MTDLDDLYQGALLDHGRRPRNFGEIEGASVAVRHNPLCGDKINVYVLIEEEVVRHVTFDGSACAIATASASILTGVLPGLAVREAKEVCSRLRAALRAQTANADGMGEEALLLGIRRFPLRVRCATLAWDAVWGIFDTQRLAEDAVRLAE